MLVGFIMGTQGNVILIHRMWKKTALSSKWVKKSELSRQWLATTPQTQINDADGPKTLGHCGTVGICNVLPKHRKMDECTYQP